MHWVLGTWTVALQASLSVLRCWLAAVQASFVFIIYTDTLSFPTTSAAMTNSTAASLTTMYCNVLSGTETWLGHDWELSYWDWDRLNEMWNRWIRKTGNVGRCYNWSLLLSSSHIVILTHSDSPIALVSISGRAFILSNPLFKSLKLFLLS